MKINLYILIIAAFITALLGSCVKPTEACFECLTTNIVTDSSVNFNASCTKYGNYPFTWNFGDGTPDTALRDTSTISHRFSSPGTYIITLTTGPQSGFPSLSKKYEYITNRTITVQ